MAKYEARGNVPDGKVQRKFYIAEALADLLRIEAAKRDESQSAIVERALRKELGLMEVTVNIIEVGAPGENYAERVASFTATLTGSHDEMVEQAIRLAEERGYTVVRNEAGGCCEVTEYSDGTVAVGITVERRALGMERLSLGRDEFAAAMGFADYEALIAASESVVQQGDVDWYVTQLPDGRWAAWDESELSLDRVAYFETREAAVQYHLDAARSAGIVEE